MISRGRGGEKGRDIIIAMRTMANLKQEDEIRSFKRKTWTCTLSLLVRIADVGIPGLALHKEDVEDLKDRAIRQIASFSYFVLREGLSIYRQGKARAFLSTLARCCRYLLFLLLFSLSKQSSLYGSLFLCTGAVRVQGKYTSIHVSIVAFVLPDLLAYILDKGTADHVGDPAIAAYTSLLSTLISTVIPACTQRDHINAIIFVLDEVTSLRPDVSERSGDIPPPPRTIFFRERESVCVCVI